MAASNGSSSDTSIPISKNMDDCPYREFYRSGNIFQKTGSGDVYEVKETKEGTFMRVDMPGICKDSVIVWLDNDTVYFGGDQKKSSPSSFSSQFVKSDTDLRIYRGRIELHSDMKQIAEVKYEIENGVLFLRILNATIKKESSDARFH